VFLERVNFPWFCLSGAHIDLPLTHANLLNTSLLSGNGDFLADLALTYQDYVGA
jgi:hypothetical protein